MTESRPLPEHLRKAVRCPKAPLSPVSHTPQERKERRKRKEEKRRRKKGGEKKEEKSLQRKDKRRDTFSRGPGPLLALLSHWARLYPLPPPSTARGAVSPALVSRRKVNTAGVASSLLSSGSYSRVPTRRPSQRSSTASRSETPSLAPNELPLVPPAPPTPIRRDLAHPTAQAGSRGRVAGNSGRPKPSADV